MILKIQARNVVLDSRSFFVVQTIPNEIHGKFLFDFAVVGIQSPRITDFFLRKNDRIVYSI